MRLSGAKCATNPLLLKARDCGDYAIDYRAAVIAASSPASRTPECVIGSRRGSWTYRDGALRVLETPDEKGANRSLGPPPFRLKSYISHLPFYQR